MVRNVNHQTSFGRTALMTASLIGNASIVKLLVDNGANVDLTDKDGSNALDDVNLVISSDASKQYSAQWIRGFLERHMKVNIDREIFPLVGFQNYNQALIYATRTENQNLFNRLFQLDLVTDIDATDDLIQATALIYAAAEGLKCMAIQLINNGADINLANCNGHTALMAAASGNHKSMVKFLLNPVLMPV